MDQGAELSRIPFESRRGPYSMATRSGRPYHTRKSLLDAKPRMREEQPEERELPPTGGAYDAPSDGKDLLWRTQTIALALHLVMTVVSTVVVAWYAALESKGYWGIRLFVYGELVFSRSYLLSPLVPMFHLLSAIAHALTLFYWEDYTRAIDNDWAWVLRWREYAISASIMTWIIATLSGADSLLVLLCLVALNVCLQITGEVGELRCREVDYNAWFVFGCLIHCTIWAVIFTSFFSAIDRAEQSVPIVVYAIAPVMFVLHSLFGVVHMAHLYYRATRIKVELMYATLSFMSKATLGIMVLAGALRERSPEAV